MNMDQPPVRLCCGQRHWSVQCPDGLVMCCLCFYRFPLEELAEEDGFKVDICQKCHDEEKLVMEKLGIERLRREIEYKGTSS